MNGQVVVFWQQAGSAVTRRWSATLDSPAATWMVEERGTPQRRTLAGRVSAVVGDTGGLIWFDLENCQAIRRVAGTWQAPTALPAGLCPTSTSFVSVMSRSGNLLGALAGNAASAGNTGQWLAYNGQLGTLQQPLTTQVSGNGYLFGVPRTLGGQLLLAENGVATFLTLSTLDSLPSAAAPAGVNGAATNLWAVVLKLL